MIILLEYILLKIIMSNKEIKLVLDPHADPNNTHEAVQTEIEALNGRKVDFSVVLGDITQADADAIVIPANPAFIHVKEGVQEAVEDAAGIGVFYEARRNAQDYLFNIGGVPFRDTGKIATPLGHTIVTGPGRLRRPKAIIHVNTLNHDPNSRYSFDEGALRVSVDSVLEAADRTGNLQSVAFSALGTGKYGMGLDESIGNTIEGAKKYLTRKPESGIQKIAYVIYAKASTKNAIVAQHIVFENMRQIPHNPQRYN